MSFGDLFVLVLFVLFVVLPSIQKAQRRGTGSPPPAAGGRPAAGSDPRPTGTTPSGRPLAPTASRPSASGSSNDAFPPLEDDELTRRLSEARERVRQAMAGGAASGQPAQRVGGTQDPRARAAAPLVRPRATSPAVDPRVRARAPLVARDLDDGLLATPLELQAAPPPRAPRSRRPGVRDLRAEAPQVEVERLAGAVSSARTSPSVLRLDAASIREGLLWHQVLGAPRARRWLGGGPSPDR